MRIVALLSLFFGLLGLMLLDGQVFTHAVQGIICGTIAIGCGEASARKARSSAMRRWIGHSLAALGLLLLAFSVTQLPGAYQFQTKFNERSRGQMPQKPKLANPSNALDGIPSRFHVECLWPAARDLHRSPT